MVLIYKNINSQHKSSEKNRKTNQSKKNKCFDYQKLWKYAFLG